jgi:2-phosphosulfolactate phosphatase
MEIDLAFSPDELKRKDLREKSVVVVDALRATSTMIVAFENGCRGFIPVATIEEAREVAAQAKNPDVLLGGERGAKPVEGFHFGNSPRDYSRERVNGKTVVLTTTNGTQALVAAQTGAEIFIGAFLNLSALTRRLMESGRDALIACSGEKGFFCLDDTVCGGALIARLEERGIPLRLREAALAARVLFDPYGRDILGLLRNCEWGRELEKLGLGEDIPICAQLDSSNLVPICREGRIFLDRPRT